MKLSSYVNVTISTGKLFHVETMRLTKKKKSLRASKNYHVNHVPT
jgi:hypothetical protein